MLETWRHRVSQEVVQEQARLLLMEWNQVQRMLEVCDSWLLDPQI